MPSANLSSTSSSNLRPAQSLPNGNSSSSKRRMSSPPNSSSSLAFFFSPSSSAVLLLLLSLLAVASWLPSAEARSVALPSPQCHPAIVNTMRPRIRQICKALEAIWEFSDVMENYLDEKESEDVMNMERPMSPAERPIMNAGVKRKVEDVDHVFLRFGKRAF